MLNQDLEKIQNTLEKLKSLLSQQQEIQIKTPSSINLRSSLENNKLEKSRKSSGNLAYNSLGQISFQKEKIEISKDIANKQNQEDIKEIMDQIQAVQQKYLSKLSNQYDEGTEQNKTTFHTSERKRKE